MEGHEAAIISARSFEGLSAITADGKPAQFAIVDADGKVIAAGQQVADAAWQTAITAYRKFLIDEGHLRIYTKAETLALNAWHDSD